MRACGALGLHAGERFADGVPEGRCGSQSSVAPSFYRGAKEDPFAGKDQRILNPLNHFPRQEADWVEVYINTLLIFVNIIDKLRIICSNNTLINLKLC